MSYILEALKKSQQERELGKVPTLDASGMFEEDTAEAPRSPWTLVAMGLAGAAVLIALYAALRGPATVAPTAPPAAEMAGLPGAAQALPAPPSPAPPPLGLQDMDHSSVAERPPIPAPVAAPPTVPADPATELAEEPLVEPPPPRRPSRPKPQEPARHVQLRSDAPIVHPDLTEESNLAAELELQRQLDAELGGAPSEDAGPTDPPTPVPRDLIADIESFKHEVLKDRGGGPAKEVPKPLDGDPTKLRLTREQEASLPKYLMTVHVYDADSSKRFVLINGRKYREGEKTRQGITVERILAQGTVLSYQGNPFFAHR